MTQKEIKKLKARIQEGFKYIARDETGDIYTYEKIPNKSLYGEWKDGGKLQCIGNYKFLPFIASNENPTLISKLIK
ncbi:Uncharacterised protein [Sebaldella termitidis]|uniref:Uncharacterized protein n=1 Tax=Sebaldella termitidis (strain ATCC 33386 / NCTC 11300) TaxID=526218 RepID=D1ANA6_SEBTE|nr:hypothetical protein [Sebaldella termitidis]ACZ09710.1 hypothetical protein Sterm_2866 [Sebaldella termitidis ATCC 33386]SUI25041.1 Uncharacterised protein [Sebaldella termitidis]